MKNLNNTNDWTLTEEDVQKDHHDNNYQMLQANMLAIKRQEKEFLSEFDDICQKFKDMLATAGINQSQFPTTPNRNFVASEPMTPTFMLTPKGLTDLDIHKCHLINTMNDSAVYEDGLHSDGGSDAEHSPMSTDTELSDFEDETVFLEREVEGCESEENFHDSMQFSTSFIAGNININNWEKKKSVSKGQGSNPLASSTMIMGEKEPGQISRKPVCRGVSIPKASSTLLYKPFPERRVNKSFSPVVKLQNRQTKPENNMEKKNQNSVETVAESIFTWSLQHSSTDVPLEESYLRTVRKRSHKMTSRPYLQPNETVNGLSIITGQTTCYKEAVVYDSLCKDNTLYNKSKTLPRTSTRSNLQKVNRKPDGKFEEAVFKKPMENPKESKSTVERKNSVVKKLLRFRESFKRKNGTTDLRTLATL